jgi:hypothetical protein
MAQRIREDLTELFRLWLDPQKARDAAQEVRSAEEMIESYPTPLPAAATLDRVKQQMRHRVIRRRRSHFMEGVAAVAAAILIVAGLSQYGMPGSRSSVGLAMLPAALWESNDIASDDVKLAYFNSEVDRLEAQVQAIESSDSDVSSTGTLDDVELELFQIDTDFWKG